MEFSEFKIQKLSSLLDNGIGEDELLSAFKLFHTAKDTDVDIFSADENFKRLGQSYTAAFLASIE